MTTLAPRSVLSPRIGRSRRLSWPWSASMRLFAYRCWQTRPGRVGTRSVEGEVPAAAVADRKGEPQPQHSVQRVLLVGPEVDRPETDRADELLHDGPVAGAGGE